MEKDPSMKLDSIPIEKLYLVEFTDNKIILSTKSEIIKTDQKIEEICRYIGKLYNNHIKEMEAKNFEKNVERLITKIASEYMDKYWGDELKKGIVTSLNYSGWKQALVNIMDKIDVQTKLMPFMQNDLNIKAIGNSIDVTQHTITIVFKNVEDDRFLQAIMSISNDFEISVKTKIGTIIFF